MIRRTFFLILLVLACCNSVTLLSVQPKKNVHSMFDELDQYEDLIEETETVTARVQEIKIPAYAEYMMRIGSWFFVQYHTLKQKCATLYAILADGMPDDENS